MFYKFFSELFILHMKYESKNQIPGYYLIAIGGASGVTSKTILYPFDLARKRLQIQGFGEHRYFKLIYSSILYLKLVIFSFRKTFGTHFECTGLLSCIKNTVKYEGIFGLYKGLLPSMLKSGVQNACMFAFYDKICSLIVKNHNL